MCPYGEEERQEIGIVTRIKKLSFVFALLPLLTTGCLFGTLVTRSDVPCLKPTAWPGSRFLLTRSFSKSDDILLVASQTTDEYEVDDDDGIIGNGPHGPVYRFDPVEESFELVPDTVWDQAHGAVTDCLAELRRPTPGFRVRGGRLEYEGRTIPVAGGTVVGYIAAPLSPVVAVLSTDGFAGIPFLTSGAASGQHYHQLFSLADGSPIGEPTRVGVGGRHTGPVAECWPPDEHYLIYEERRSAVNPDRVPPLCVVNVADELEAFQGE